MKASKEFLMVLFLCIDKCRVMMTEGQWCDSILFLRVNSTQIQTWWELVMKCHWKILMYFILMSSVYCIFDILLKTALQKLEPKALLRLLIYIVAFSMAVIYTQRHGLSRFWNTVLCINYRCMNSHYWIKLILKIYSCGTC